MSYSTPNDSSFGELIEKTYRRLMSGQREQTIQLSSAITGDVTGPPFVAAQTTFSVTGVQTGTLAVGAQIACEMEVMLITAFSGTTGTATFTVVRG